eukprot:scaffold158276_cov37-Prasinocladus_malaysianus.AAC.1
MRWGSLESYTACQPLTSLATLEASRETAELASWLLPSSVRTHSLAQTRGETHSAAGLASLLVVDDETPLPAALPVSKKSSSWGGRRPSESMMRVASRKENISLSFSNNEWHTLLYRLFVKCEEISVSRASTGTSPESPDGLVSFLRRLLSPMLRTKSPTNQSREYWYMGSTAAISATQKNSTALEAPEGL